MNGFEEEKVPGWLLDEIDARTTLPHGPLESFPIPLGGEIVGGRALVPKSGSPARYVVNAVCIETHDETTRFLTEYLPLAGYIVFGEGSLPARRNLLTRRTSRPFELLLIRKPPFVGTVLVSPAETSGTCIEADLAHPSHPDANGLIDFENPRANTEIRWRRLEN
jgi:hypothetical protein